MKIHQTITTLILLLLISTNQFAQERDPLLWKNFSNKTVVFEIKDKEAEKLLREYYSQKKFEKLTSTPIAVFENEWKDAPAQGHFIYANIKENKVHFKYAPRMPFQVFLFKEYGQLTMQVVDAEGNIRDDAKISIHAKWRFWDTGIPYDKESKTYTINDMSEKGTRIMTVELDKYKAVFELKKHFVSPIYNNSNYSTQRPDFYSYMITDKNKYKPGENVRFKSYALSAGKRPIKENLDIWMSTSKGYSYKRISTVAPYNPGGFAGEVQLHDSLELLLDKNYSIQLRDKKGRIVASDNFKYEDYELYDNKMEVTVESGTHYYPNTNNIEIKVIDANGLVLPDMKAKIVVKRNDILKSYVDVLALSDTLVNETINLDNAEPTNFAISPTLFGESDCNYVLNIEAFSHDNQRMTFSRNITFYRSHYHIAHNTVNDSIKFEFFNLGKPQKMKAKLWYDSEKEPKIIDLPHQEKFKQSATSYTISTLDIDYYKHLKTQNIDSELELLGGFVKDSFNIALKNPLDLDVTWYIYEGEKLLGKGAGKEIDFKSYNLNYDITYYVELFYFMGQQELALRKAFVPKAEHLTVDVDLPSRVYPGQTVDATIQVSDFRGKGVKGVDLTAFAFNSLLNHKVYDLPYYGGSPAKRDQQVSYDIHRLTNASRNMTLDYKRWNGYVTLDSLKYYQFMYPQGNIFKQTIATPDSTTQFTPYVVQGGEIQQVYVVENNHEPIYFSWTAQPRRYSFVVDPDSTNRVALRLYDRAILIDSIKFEKGKKTIFSINLDSLPKGVKEIKFDNSRFTNTEAMNYTKLVSKIPVISNHAPAYLNQDDKSFLIYHPCFNSGNDKILAGPIEPGMYNYNEGVKYRHEGGFDYKFEDNVVYKYPTSVLPQYLDRRSSTAVPAFNSFALTPSELEKSVDICRRAKEWYPQAIHLSQNRIETKFLLPYDRIKESVYQLFLINRETEKVSIVNEHTIRSKEYQPLYSGVFNAYLVYNDGTYLRKDSIPLHPYTFTLVNMQNSELNKADAQSREWLGNRARHSIFNDGSTASLSFQDISMFPTKSKKARGANTVVGVVKEQNGEPLIGVSVLLKGTTTGTITDLDGEFEIDLPAGKNTLVFSYLGFITKELSIEAGSSVTVILEEDAKMLEEVVVVGYGMQRKSSMTGAMSSTSGYNDEPSKSSPSEELDEADDSSSDDGEDQLYQELMQLNGLRSNFSDVGFWQPALITDKHGNAKFSATFPDNITKWEAVVYAMNRNLKTGTARKYIKSYKPIMAELKTPRFLVVGDSSYFAGNVRNHTKDKNISGKIRFAIESDTLMNKAISFSGAYQDKLLVTAPVADSIAATYLFDRNDGYSDGERRSISIQPQGTELAKGNLTIMRNGEEAVASAGGNEEVFVTLTGNQLDIYLEVSDYLTNYKYACNEQLASKLIGLLNVRLHKQFKNEKFKNDKDVNKIIKRLLSNQNKDKLWSWWGNSNSTSYWMSAHILRALRMAKDAGYTVDLRINTIQQDYVDTRSYRHSSINDISILHALSEWDAEQSYKSAVEIMDSQIMKLEAYEDSVHNAWKAKKPSMTYTKRSYLTEKLLLAEIRQKQDIGFDREMIKRYLKKDVVGGVYCDDGLYRPWYSDKDATTIIAYRIVKNDSILRDMKEAMQMYILGTKRYGWNTYQASSAVSAILPDLLAEVTNKDELSSVQLSGKENKTLTKFPYQTKLIAGEQLKIEKKSGIPLIYSSYTIKRETKENIGDAFEVSTQLSDNELVAGTPVTMTVKVRVKQKNAEHIMIEAPIPAGCSYASKPNWYYGREMHREYFKEKTVIFCESLPVDEYTFTIDLLPRYSGSYMLNPAKVEMMYFPVINANNDMRKVEIQERK